MRNIDNALSDALEVLKFSNHELWDLSAELSAYLEKNPSFGTNDSMLYMMFRMDMMMNHINTLIRRICSIARIEPEELPPYYANI